eukprot:4542824-Pleurochrysis_carterae.AAC.1
MIWRTRDKTGQHAHGKTGRRARARFLTGSGENAAYVEQQIRSKEFKCLNPHVAGNVSSQIHLERAQQRAQPLAHLRMHGCTSFKTAQPAQACRLDQNDEKETLKLDQNWECFERRSRCEVRESENAILRTELGVSDARAEESPQI